jgi:glycosyltransferase involved in cell wall biosynthesis
MLISVVMPVFNAEKFLAYAIESILNQTYPDFEFIIIDDGSTDDSLEIINKYEKQDDRIKVIINNGNIGLAKSLNKGIELAKGKYIARMDADDISLPERFEKQISFLENNPSIGVLGTSFKLIDGKNIVQRKIDVFSDSHLIRWGMFFKCQMAHPSVMMRNSIFKDLGIRYEESLSSASDYDLWFQILSHYDMANLSTSYFLYRIHKNRISSTKKEEQQINAEQVLRLRTQEFLTFELPPNYGKHIMTYYQEGIDFCDLVKILWIITKLKNGFINKYPNLSNDEKVAIKRDYEYRISKIFRSLFIRNKKTSRKSLTDYDIE